MSSKEKEKAIEAFHRHVSPGKADFYRSVGMDFVMGRRHGPFLWDMDGEKRLFNLHCNGGVFNLGHRNPEILSVLAEAMGEIDIGNGHLMSAHRARLAQSMARLTPGDLNFTVFGVSGGEAVDLAIKAARAFTGKIGIVSACGGYHGHTGLAMAAGDTKYREPFGPQPEGFAQAAFGDLAALEKIVDGQTAAVILETVPATLGMVVPSREYMQGVRLLCDKAGALLILDEVQTGLGRTGKLWAFEHFDVLPDIMVLAKGLSGGLYPITATIMREPLSAVFSADPFIHISTFGGAEIGCAVAQKVLEISSAPDFLSHVNALAKKFSEGIGQLATRHPVLTGLNQLGLFMGLKFCDEALGPLMSLAAYQNDILMVYANNDRSVCQLLPPLVMDMEQTDWVLDRLDRALTSVGQFFDGSGKDNQQP